MRKPATRARSGTVTVPGSGGGPGLSPASWAAIIIAVRTVAASSPNSADQARSTSAH